MFAPVPETTFPVPARTDSTAPRLAAVVRHLALSLFVATVVPTVVFYVCLVTVGLWAALVGALMWCYATVAWRLRTRQPTSALLWLTVAGLTGKTIVVFATGSTFIYFVQPALGDAVVAAVFLVSLMTARPGVSRLAADFYPMTHDVAARPRVRTLFTRLTLLWAGICAIKAAATVWLLHTLSLTTFVAAKTIFAPSAAMLGAAITVALAVRVARREGLLAIRRDARPTGVSA